MKLDGELVVNFGARLLGRFRRVFDGILWDGERINIVALFDQAEQSVSDVFITCESPLSPQSSVVMSPLSFLRCSL